MQRIVYYVAVTLDGFIAGPGNDISMYLPDGPGVRQYQEDLKSFGTVIMGRNTYEFGYQFGLQPGQPAYPHMEHYIFSDRLHLDNTHEKVHVCKPEIKKIEEIKSTANTDIYLCGGGTFAGWLMENQMIDVMKIKLNPAIAGGGIPLFHGLSKSYHCKHKHTESFEDGLQILTYDVIHQNSE